MAESEAIKPLKIDADLWSHRDLIERIVSRWFHIIEDMDDVEIGWRVSLKGQDLDSEKALIQLNKHLNRLSWFATLQDGKPFDLVIIPKLLGREPGLSVGQMAAVWLIFTSFLTLAGVAWLQHQDPGPKLTDPDLLSHSFSWFALPIALVMGIGSEIRRRFALKAGVELGHHIPLAVPFLMTPTVPIWPFGVIGFTSQRRLELLPFKDRKSLALVSIIAPLIMIISGMILTVLGYVLTSNSSPSFGESPISVSASVLPELLLSLYIPAEELSLRSSWLHPMGLAGITLNTMGWILLLPLPGFPGDRLLSALLSPGEMEEGGTQTWLFVGVLVAGIYIVFNGGFWPWLMLVALGAWRRFSPEASAIPFVLNEAKEFSDRSKNAFSIVLVAALLLGFPGLLPVQELDDWDAGLDTSEWPSEFIFVNDEINTLELPLNTLGVMDIDIEFEFRISGSWDDVNLLSISEECGDIVYFAEIECQFDDIGPLSEQSLKFTLQSQNEDQPSVIRADLFSLEIYWLEQLDTRSHQVNFSYQSTPIPTEMSWIWDGDSDTPQYCVNMTGHSELPGNISIESIPAGLFTFDSSPHLSLPAGENSTICIDGVFGTHHLLRSDEIQTHLLTTLDDGSVYRSEVTLESDLHLPGGYWPATTLSNAFSMVDPSLSAEYLMWFEEIPESTHCPLSRVEMSIPTDDNGSWELNMSEIPEMTLPENRINGTVLLPDYGHLIACSNHQTAWAATLVPSNGILHQGVNHGNSSIEIRVETTDFGTDHDWNLSDFTLLSGESLPEFNHTNDNDVVQIVWVEPTTEEWILHLISHCINPSGCLGGQT